MESVVKNQALLNLPLYAGPRNFFRSFIISHLIVEPALEVVRPELPEPWVPAVDPPPRAGVGAVREEQRGAEAEEVLVKAWKRGDM